MTTLQAKFQDFLKLKLPKISWESAQAVIELHKQGATVPFIARYRKEKTRNLDEVQVRDVLENFETYNEVIQRQAFILKEVEAQGNLTPELKNQILHSLDLAELEEVYRPYKKKKKTKAKIAKEAGIEPFADWLWGLTQGQISDETTIEVKAKQFLNPTALFATYQEVIKGAEEILIERLMNNLEVRAFIRNHLMDKGKIISKKGKQYKANSKYDMYTTFQESIKKLFDVKASYRYMAMKRGWAEGELTLTIEGEGTVIEDYMKAMAIKKPNTQAQLFMEETLKNALNLHLMPSISNEIHKKLKDTADGHAIDVFAQNVTKILLGSPFGSKCVLGIDPGLKTGAKVALVNSDGSYVSHTILNILGENAEAEAEKLFKDLFAAIKVDAIAVGNGTAGRETESFVRKVLKKLEVNIPVTLVNESGASVYSASEVAREEFPDLDLTIRGAISIARRLQDPLAELVKIDPQSIGVGQYQHDVPPNRLKKSLDAVVESCVNKVGIDLNTASPYILQFISGIGPAVAKNVVEYKKNHGLFKNRDDLLKVKNFSTKIFEQSAGFLRINGGENILDQTGIHPERYSAIRELADELGTTPSGLLKEGAKKILEVRTKWAELIGEFTLNDIIKELENPGRDPRDLFKAFSFRDDVFEMKDLKEGMICPGIVTNVTNFGAFVDIGVHQDGLVHISELTHQFVDDPRKVVNPGDQVEVKVMKVDLEKKQIFLTMKLTEAPKRAERSRQDYQPRSERATKHAESRHANSGKAESGHANPRQTEQRPKNFNQPQKNKEFRGDFKHANNPKGGGGKSFKKHDERPQQQRQKPAFNNPFAQLAELKGQIKK